MSSTRLWLRLLALAVIVDLAAVMFVRAPGPGVLFVPLVGTTLASLACWSDAASSFRRRLLAVLATVATASIVYGFALALEGGIAIQAMLLAAFAVLGAIISVRSWRTAGRRRLRSHGYYLPDPTPMSANRRQAAPAMGRNLQVVSTTPARVRRIG